MQKNIKMKFLNKNYAMIALKSMNFLLTRVKLMIILQNNNKISLKIKKILAT